jgi:hypothetical protein
MMRQLFYLTLLWLITSCTFNQSDIDQHGSVATLDTLTIFDGASFTECGKVVKKTIVFDLIEPAIKIADISMGNGTVYRKVFLRKDSVLIKFLFENIKVYEEDIMFRSSEGLTTNTVFYDTLLEIANNYQISKSFGIEGEWASLNYVVFDSLGYFHINVIDQRKIPFIDSHI